MGQVVAASADRHRGDPLAMNNTPPPRTIHRGFAHTLATLKALSLGRFAAGAPVDLRLDLEDDPPAEAERVIQAVVTSFVENDGNVLSVTLGDATEYRTIYDLAVKSSNGDQQAGRELLDWGHVMVRAGGWQTPFITMSLAQQEHYAQARRQP
jgi:formate C-acetyltransferase